MVLVVRMSLAAACVCDAWLINYEASALLPKEAIFGSPGLLSDHSEDGGSILDGF